MTRATKTLALTAGAACTLCLALSLPGTAGAGTPLAVKDTLTIGNPVAGNNGFGVVTEQNATLGSTESEGPVAIGGDLRFGDGYNVALNHTGGYTAPGDSEPTALLVGGSVDYAGSSPTGVLKVLRDAYVKIGDMTGSQALNRDQNGAIVHTHIDATGRSYDATPRIELTTTQPASSVGPADLMDFPALFTTYRERAQEMARCTDNVVLRDGNGTPLADQDTVPANANLKVTLTEGITNVLHITGANLNNIGDLTFTNPPTADTPFLVVVDTTDEGGDFTWHTPTLAGAGGAAAPSMLWNFPDATSITVADGDTIEGTVFAPSADLTDLDASNMEGDIIVKSLVAGPLAADGRTDVNAGEIHYFPFAADLSCEGMGANGSPTPTPTPTPSPTEPTSAPSPGTPTPTPTPSPTEPTSAPSPGTPTPSTPSTPSTPAPSTPTPTAPAVVVPSTPAPSPTGPTLANTGAGRHLRLLGVIASGAVGAGAGVMLWAGRRRRAH
ncbi:choice-of-anchor A family protein [Streptomyces sp. Q6]|uniref:Choice-of-anchor A family protein n=1 Tax=Streptomyces citrinus TaxID=3118173 RepID=A0ACD5AGK8_9ACTN